MLIMSIHGKINRLYCFILLALADMIFILSISGGYKLLEFENLPLAITVIIGVVTAMRYMSGIESIAYTSSKGPKQSPKGNSSVRCVIWIVVVTLLPFPLIYIDDSLFTQLNGFQLFVVLWYLIIGPLVTGFVIGVVRELKTNS